MFAPATTTYLDFLDEVVEYALATADGIAVPHPSLSDGLALEVNQIIATVKAAQKNRCVFKTMVTFIWLAQTLQTHCLGMQQAIMMPLAARLARI